MTLSIPKAGRSPSDGLMKRGMLLRALGRIVAWCRHVPAARDITLLRDAEFQIMLTELRYPPIRHLQAVRVVRKTGGAASTGSRRT